MWPAGIAMRSFLPARFRRRFAERCIQYIIYYIQYTTYIIQYDIHVQCRRYDNPLALALPLDPADMPDVCRFSSVSWLADDSRTSARPGGWLREE